MKRPLGVCMVTGAFYPEISGAGLQCKTLIDSLKHDSIKFFVLTTTRSPFLKDNNQIFRIYVGNLGLCAKFKAGLRVIFIFLRIHRKVDIIHIHGFSNKNMLIVLLAKVFRKKLIQKMTSLGDDDPCSIMSKRFGTLRRLFFSKADIFISISPAMSMKFIEAGFPHSKLATIPNGVDVEKFKPPKDLSEKAAIRKELNLPENGALILFVGFFSKDKGPDILFEAFKSIRNEAKEDLYIIFIGATKGEYFEIDTDLVKAIKKDIENLSIEDKVIFIESTLEIEKYYKASDLFILPSLREGLPNALMEAMSSGLPCIVSDLESINNYLCLHEKECLMFQKGDKKALLECIYALSGNKDYSRNLAINARQKIISEFSLEKVSKQYERIYKSITYDGKHLL